MAVWSIINANDVATSGRCDAEYFTPENLRLASTLEKRKPVRIDSFADVTDGIHGSPEWVNAGVTYLSAKCVREHFVDIKTAGQISSAQDATNPRTRARVGDVVITSVGTIGNAAVVEDWMLPANMDRHLGIIRIRDHKKVDPYFLATFLNSAFGRFQSTRESTGNVQLNLFIEKIRGIRVPTTERLQEVGKFVRNACAELRSADSLYPEAEAELLERLGWDELHRKPVELSYVRDFEEIATAARTDAEHFQPRYDRIETRLRERGCKALGELIEPVINGFDCRDWSDAGTPYIRVGDVARCEISSECQRVNLVAEEVGKAVEIKVGDVLFTRKGTFGRAAAVKASHVGWIISSEIMRLRPLPDAVISPGYLALYFCSPVGFALVEKFVHGVSNFSISQGDMKKLLIYLPRQKNGTVDLAWQQRLATKVESAAAAKTAARAKLEEAKRLVEEALK